MAADARQVAATSTLDAALRYAARGWRVLPVRAGDKVPLTAHGVKDASTDESTIRRWCERWPSANVAVACGAASGGLVVLDCDQAEFSWALEKSCGPLPETLTVATGRGSHRYFHCPEPIRTQTLIPHLEVRAEGSYIVAPPSVHPNGARYRVINDVAPAPLPPALLELLRSPTSPAVPAGAPEKIREGQRNTMLTSLAGLMRRHGMTCEGIELALIAENAAHCEPPLPEPEVRQIARSISRYEPAKANRMAAAVPTSPPKDGSSPLQKEERESAATALVKLARDRVELFHFGEVSFATVTVGQHQETFALRSRSFRSWLTKAFFEEQQRAAGGEAIASAITTLEGFARFQCVECAVFIRLAEHAGKVFLDLCTPTWQMIKIGPEGWQLIEAENCPVRFRRPHGMLPLPVPERDGRIEPLREFINVATDDDFRLIVGWLLAALHPTGPYPVLILHGEQGAGKSTTARILRGLFDPNIAPIRSEPKEPRDLAIAANNSWLCTFDNISHLSDWLSDGLCRLSTGGGFATRLLYSDDEEQIFDARRPVILNSIEEVATRPDLLDRSLILYLPQIMEERRREEGILWPAFEQARPKILGALLDAVSCALRGASVTLERQPRMLDAAVWVARAEPAFGWQSGTFAGLYCANTSTASELPLETPVGEALRKIELPWTGTATELLGAIESLTDERVRHSKNWPGSGRGLSNSLRRLASNLRHVGIEVEFTREGKSRRRLITLSEKGGISSSASSVSSQKPDLTDVADARDDKSSLFSDAIVEGEDTI